MSEAFLWGLLASSSLVIGAVIAMTTHPPKKATGLVLGFGGGTLISAISFELTEEAYALGGADALTFGLAAGALVFYVGDILISPKRGKDGREMPEQDESGKTLLLGALLDGVPETAVLGSTLIAGSGIGVPVLAAIFLSNLPEGIGGASDMRTTGVPDRRVLALWTGVALICAASSGIGYEVLANAGDEAIAIVQAFAAGGVLAMLAIEMLPEAHSRGGRGAGLMTVFGFALAYLLSTIG
ncbi:MAG: zinc transporter, family [Solirubrobacterales bacterium]|nr:zinc transporter, family [Solirubrobacterales bacterium]